LLCTLRDGRRLPPRNTRYQTNATSYLDRTFTGWITPTSWRTDAIYISHIRHFITPYPTRVTPSAHGLIFANVFASTAFATSVS